MRTALDEAHIASFGAKGESMPIPELCIGADGRPWRRLCYAGVTRQVIEQITFFGAQLRFVVDVLPRATAAAWQIWAGRLASVGTGFNNALGIGEGEGAAIFADDDVDFLTRHDAAHEDDFALETADAVWTVAEIVDVNPLRHSPWLSLREWRCNRRQAVADGGAVDYSPVGLRRDTMSERPHGLMPSAGSAVLHLYYRIDRSRWRAIADRALAVEEFITLLRQTGGEAGLQLMLLAGVTKSDFGLIAVHTDLWRIQQLTQEVAATAFGSCLQPVYEFLSLSEASEYISSELDWARSLIEEQKLDPASPEFNQRIGQMRKRTAMYSAARLNPQLPEASYPMVCFYPMAKARRDVENWYLLDFDTRKKLMLEHGNSGRRFADRVTQLITTCTGIDDWEWGVTLFAKDPKAIRDIVYELRYDEASARYGMFGSFYISLRFDPDQLAEVLHI
jgi:hydrogen peroxide-dependent heme synthase